MTAAVARLPLKKEDEIGSKDSIGKAEKEKPFVHSYIPINVAVAIGGHIVGLLGTYYLIATLGWKTKLFALFLSYCSGVFGVTCGAHRLWTHRSYKATLPLRLFYLFWATIAGQDDVIKWCRDHRSHHKWTDTDADPYGTQNGYFFAHMGWLMCKKHPEVYRKGATLDLSDLYAERILVWQRRLYVPLMVMATFLLPAWLPHYWWGEDLFQCMCASVARQLLSLHGTWSVNSAAHWAGNKPYDVDSTATEHKFFAWLTYGEGGHNFHHVFPNDYRNNELPYTINSSRFWIELFVKMGLAYDLKVASKEVIRKTTIRREKRAKELGLEMIHHDIWAAEEAEEEEETTNTKEDKQMESRKAA